MKHIERKMATAKRQSVLEVVAMTAVAGAAALVAGPGVGFLALLGSVGLCCRLMPSPFGPEDYTE